MIQDSYITLYQQCEKGMASRTPAWWQNTKAAALSCLQEKGLSTFPHAYDVDYGMNVNRVPVTGNPFSLFTCNIPGISSYNCMVVNDTFFPPVDADQLPAGVILCSLWEAMQEHASLVEPYLGKLMSPNENGDHAFNALFAQDGLFLYVPSGVEIDKPIQLINLMYATSEMMGVSHNLVIVGKNAKAQVLVCDHVYGKVNYLSNRVSEVFVEEGATYEHYKMESTTPHMTNVCSLLLSQKENSEVLTNIITLQNGHSSNRVEANLDGKGAFLSLNGLGLGSGEQKILNHTYINHNQAGATSRELYKYVLDEQAFGDFFGMIKVLPGAQQTDANQTNRNLCLSPTAKMHTRPQLEIYADDVKCNHGATVGQLDENALFYMQTRGLSEKEARMLLMFAFVQDVLDNVRISVLKDRLQVLIEKRLRGDLPPCKACNACHH